MARGTAQHVRAIMAIANAISAAIGSTQVSCEVFVEGPSVLVDENSAYIPDVSVNCGERLEDNARFLSNPIVLIEVLSPSTKRVPLIVVEVLSPSTERLDKAGKLADYFSIPSIAHYLIVDLKRRHVIHHSRGEGGMIPTRIVREGSIALDPPGITMRWPILSAPELLLLRQVQPDVQLAELLCRDFRRRAHEQVFGLLVQREHRHVT